MGLHVRKAHRPRLTLSRSTAWLMLIAGSWMAVRAQAIPAAPVATAPSKSQDPLNRESPQSAVVSFLEACHAHQYERAGKYFDLRNSPADQRMKDGAELAQQLERILDRDAQFDVATLSRS